MKLTRQNRELRESSSPMEVKLSEIKRFYESYWDLQIKYGNDSELDCLSWVDFVRITSTMNIKTRGTKIEKRILRLNGWQKARGRAAPADGLDRNGKSIEIKSSVLSPLEGSDVTFRGIRPWAKIDEHLFILINLQNHRTEAETSLFRLNQHQILREVDLGALKPYNMKREDRLQNEKTELGSSFRNGDLKRWKQLYPVEDILLESHAKAA